MDIVTLGELLIDMFPAETGVRLAEVSAFHPNPGGAPANVAVAAARLGAESAFIGKVGDDHFGHFLRDTLKNEGVHTAGIRFDDEARTTMAIIAKPDAATAQFIFYRNPGADQRLRTAELDLDLLESTRAFHFGSLSLTDEPAAGATLHAVQTARTAGALISYDVNYRPTLWSSPRVALAMAHAMLPQVDVLKVNDVELSLLAHTPDIHPSDHDSLSAAARKLLAEGPALVVVTLGSQGAFFQLDDASGHVAPFPVETVDAVGCGDTFIAALLTRLIAPGDWRASLNADDLHAALRYANAAAAVTATRQGVIRALPTPDEVQALLAEHD